MAKSPAKDGGNNQETADQVPTVVLLADEPSTSDDFDAKAHERVARAIADLVTHEDGGRVVGLEGSWGSGKSTVVQLLCDRLHSHAPAGDVTSVVFDTWAHQGDPLRRTFLEKIIDELSITSHWLSSSDADEFRTELSGRHSIVRTRSSARLSIEGRLASAATVLLPLGAVLLANKFTSHHRMAQILGLLLLLGPLLVVLGFVAAKLIGIALGGRRKSPKDWRRRLAALRAFSFFANEQETNTDTEGIERGDPTSVEFEKLFSRVLEASLKSPRRLLIVLDNLDRVEESDAKTVLATMQTFTGSVNSRNEWAGRVWTLIPYDPAGLDRLWSPDEDGTEPGHTPTAGSRSGAAFIEKLFQVRFEAPPLVLSDWRSYLLRLLNEAMPTAGDEKSAVLRLRAAYPGAVPNRMVAGESPTPRQLKQFVNQIGAIRRQRDDVPLVHMAYYVLLKHDGFDIPNCLLDKGQALPHPRISHLLNQGIRDDLAALHFGTTQDLARQLVIGRALEQAFASGDSSPVQPVLETPGFVDALESLDLGGRLEDGAIELTRAAAVLGSVDAFDRSDVADWSKNLLEPVARDVDSWSLSGRETGIGAAILFDRLCRDDVALAECLNRIAIEAQTTDTDGHLQLAGLAGLADELNARGRTPKGTHVRVDIPTDRLVESLAYYGSQVTNRRSLNLLELTIPPDQVAHTIAAVACSEGHALAPRALDVLATRPERIDFGILMEDCLEWLRNQDPPSRELLVTVLDTMDRSRRAGAPPELLQAAADDGTLMHVVALAQRQGWFAESATASMLHLIARPKFEDPQISREAASGVQVVRETLTAPTSHMDLFEAQLAWLETHSREAEILLIRVASTAEFRPWTDELLRKIQSSTGLVMTDQQYLRNWTYFRSVLGDEVFAGLTDQILSKPKSRQAILAGSSDPTLAAVVLAATQQTDYASDVRTWAKKFVQGAPQADWLAALEDVSGGSLIPLALQLADTRNVPSNPSGLLDALHTHAQKLAAGEAVWQPNADTFAKLSNLLNASARGVLASQLCAGLEGRDGQISAGLFTTYGDFLAGERRFRTHPKLPNVIERLVAHDAWDSVSWVAELAKQHPDTLQSKGREDELKHLADRVAQKLEEVGAEPPDALSTLATLLIDKKSGGQDS